MKSDYIILNTLSLTFVAMTYYFSIRRSAIRFIPNLFASIIYLVLWIIAYNPSSTYAILFATNGAFEIIWVIYGFFSWNKIRKNQEQKLIEKKESKIDTN
jgi:uncharacterized membrane protein YjjP (DUF1212 family)